MKTIMISNSIPVCEHNSSNSGTTPKPLIIILHWLGGNKEMMTEYANQFDRSNYFIISIDCALHGERKPIEAVDNSYYYNLNPSDFFAIHTKTASEINTVIE